MKSEPPDLVPAKTQVKVIIRRVPVFPPQSQTGGRRPVQVPAILVTMSSVTWPGTQNCRGSDADTCHVLLARDTRMFGH